MIQLTDANVKYGMDAATPFSYCTNVSSLVQECCLIFVQQLGHFVGRSAETFEILIKIVINLSKL